MSRRAALLVALAATTLPAGQAEAEDAPGSEVMAVVAAIIRAQGMACTSPTSVTRDSQASKPEEPVYSITCSEATYRVRVVPDQASEITRQ